ncbi:unnamed protein product, partial [Allacma fusca]
RNFKPEGRSRSWIPFASYYAAVFTLLSIPYVMTLPHKPPQIFSIQRPLNTFHKWMLWFISSLGYTRAVCVRIAVLLTVLLSVAAPALLVLRSGIEDLMETSRRILATPENKKHDVLANMNRSNLEVKWFIQKYYTLQILALNFNSLYSGIAPIMQVGWMMSVIVGIVNIINSRFSTYNAPMMMNLKSTGLFIVLAINMLAGIVYNHVSGSIFEDSSHILLHRRRQMYYKVNRLKLSSLQTLKVHCGPLFYFDKGIKLTVLRTIQDYVINLLLI